MNWSSLKASTSLERSIGSIRLSSDTFFKNDSYYWRLLLAESLTIWLKVSRSSFHNKLSSLAMIVAYLGVLYRSESSPKDSPGWYVLINVGAVLPGNILTHYKVPLSTTKTLLPSSPCTITFCFCSVMNSYIAIITVSFSFSGSELNIKAPSSFSRIPAIYA